MPGQRPFTSTPSTASAAAVALQMAISSIMEEDFNIDFEIMDSPNPVASHMGTPLLQLGSPNIDKENFVLAAASAHEDELMTSPTSLTSPLQKIGDPVSDKQRRVLTTPPAFGEGRMAAKIRKAPTKIVSPMTSNLPLVLFSWKEKMYRLVPNTNPNQVGLQVVCNKSFL